MSRRVLLTAIVFLGCLLLLVVMMPWWLGAVARPVATRFGASFGRYERIGYGRFALHDVEIRRNNVLVRIERVEADTPAVWTWQHVKGTATGVTAGAWSVEVSKRADSVPPTPSGWIPLRSRLLRIAAALQRWLPEAAVGRGLVRWPTGQLQIREAHWANGALAVKAFQFRTVEIDGTVTFDRSGDAISVSATNPAAGARVVLSSVGAAVSGSVAWWDQVAMVTARYADLGWVPATGMANADGLRIPGERLKVGTLYAVVAGRVAVQWQAGRFSANIVLHGDPRPGVSSPPLDLVARTQGDATAISIQELHATAPGLVADLDAPATFERSGALREPNVRFTLRCDLSQQPWLQGRGIVSGQVRVQRQPGHLPVFDFELAADGLELRGASARALRARGRLEWPVLGIQQLEIVGIEGETLRVTGDWDFAAKELREAKASGSLRPATIARWLPRGLRFDAAEIDASAAGTLRDLGHSGHITVTGVQAGNLRPANVAAQWTGRGAEVSSFTANAVIGAAQLDAAGSVGRDGATLTRLVYSRQGAQVLSLARPATVAFRPGIAVEGLDLVGVPARISGAMRWGPAGRVQLAIGELRSEWVDDFLPLRGPKWTLSSFAVTAAWDNAPATFEIVGRLAVEVSNRGAAVVSLSGRGDGKGVVIDALRAVESRSAVVSASGRLPVVLRPGATPLVQIDSEGAVALEASTLASAGFWQQLTALSGVELRAPNLQAHVKGTWSRPEGVITFEAERAAMDPKRFSRPLPLIEAVQIAVRAERDAITLEHFDFKVEGQAVRASGKLPMGRDTWDELMRSPLPYLQRGATLRLEIPDAEVARFARFLPAALAPAGQVRADVSLSHGQFSGFLRLRQAASKPLGPLGVLQDISADVEFADHRVDLKRVTATAGGQPITLSGSLGLPQRGTDNRYSQPRYDIGLSGQNLPFVRQAGLLVRGDLELRLRTPAKGPPSISGKVALRDSLFLTDVRSFLPRGSGASPSRRPPYFSVDTPPLNTWTLDIDVAGTRFMRMRTPVFVGVASTKFHLGGTLGEPRAIGEATIDDGQVLMPFASFAVKQGAVRLTEENPYEPTVFLRGTGRHYGYDLTMEVSGSAAAPSITFTSSPALDSEQVLLMVMTGAAPSNGVNTSLTQRAVQIGAFFGQSLYGSLTGSDGSPDRLAIESGAKISRQGKETYSIEYKLTDRLSVTGEYDEFDEYNAGLKWRVTPRKLDR